MYRITTAIFTLIVAASICCAPALAAQVARTAAGGSCTVGDDTGYRMLLVADAGAPSGLLVWPMPAVRKVGETPRVLDSVALRQDVPRSLPVAAQSGHDGQKEQWVRLADGNSSSEPGIWALLLAGFLGICAVARPRIFSS